MSDEPDSLEELKDRGRSEREEGIERYQNEDHPRIPDYRAEWIAELDEEDKIVLLGMTMRSLRGNWNEIRKREAMIHHLCKEIEEVPDAYLEAVRYNAYQLNGHLIDGRVFRDGARRTGLSGNLAAKATGDDREGDGWKGTYGELWEMGYDPDEEQRDRLAELIPNDLTYSGW